MPKGLFLCLPSHSVSNTLLPLIESLCAAGYEMLVYNTANFQPKDDTAYTFKPYPPYEGGYQTHLLHTNLSLFQFGEVLMDTAGSLMDFLLEEVEQERPDFVLHSHLAVWGKLLAQYYQLPAVSLFTTFVLDPAIMLPYLKQNGNRSAASSFNLFEGKQFFQKSKNVLDKLQLAHKPDIWDMYINREALNISFILEDFQIQPELLDASHAFVGFPIRIPHAEISHQLIYVSLGTIFNQHTAFFQLCVQVLTHQEQETVISIGKHVKRESLGELPPHITALPFVKQIETLKKTAVFITQGGMASVQEAVYTLSPMIVVPGIPEQQLTAKRIEELGIGIHLPMEKVNTDSLSSAIRHLQDKHATYVSNMLALLEKAPKDFAPELGTQLIDTFLQSVRIA